MVIVMGATTYSARTYTESLTFVSNSNYSAVSASSHGGSGEYTYYADTQGTHDNSLSLTTTSNGFSVGDGTWCNKSGVSYTYIIYK